MGEPILREANDGRVGMSTISFRHRSLKEALEIIAALGITEVDLGAIPNVVNHVPVPLEVDPERYEALLSDSGLMCGAINTDVGDLNDPRLSRQVLSTTATPLIKLAARLGAALIVPSGRQSWEPFVDEQTDLRTMTGNLRHLGALCVDHGVRLQVELVHHLRFIHSTDVAQRLLDAVDSEVLGLLLDVSHVVASGEDPVGWLESCAGRVERVHLRDAVSGDLNRSIGKGEVNFSHIIRMLEYSGFNGQYILELETHDIAEEFREQEASRSTAYIRELLEHYVP